MEQTTDDRLLSQTETPSMKELLASIDVNLPKLGTIIEGEIIGLSKNFVMVDLNVLGTGVVYPSQFYDNHSLQKDLELGQKVSAVLIAYEDEEGRGFRELSLQLAQMTTAWTDIKEKKETGEIITTKVMNINKGGLIVEINGVQGFLPLSQLSPEHYPKVEGGDTSKIVQALQKFRNQELQMKILDFSEEENKLIVSEKAIKDQQMKQVLAKFKAGDIIDGIVTDITDFGAFVKLSVPADSSKGDTTGEDPASVIEGLIHISEMDWKIIENPRDLVSEGQNIKAQVLSTDNGKISLSLKSLLTNPWKSAGDKYKVGQQVKGRIAKITSYGVLISVNNELTGLLPLVEFGDKRPSEVLKIGEEKDIYIASIDTKDHKMLLSFNLKQPEKES